MDKLTVKASCCTRGATLRYNLPAVKIVTANPRAICPLQRESFTRELCEAPKYTLVASCPPKATPLTPRFLEQGEVVTKLDSSAVLVRSGVGNKKVVASQLTFSCGESMCTLPKEVSSVYSRKYGCLVHGGVTRPVASVSSLVGDLNLKITKATRNLSKDRQLRTFCESSVPPRRVALVDSVFGVVVGREKVDVRSVSVSTKLPCRGITGTIGVVRASKFVDVSLLRQYVTYVEG